MSCLALLCLLADPEWVRSTPYPIPDGVTKAVEPVAPRGDENRFTHGPVLGRLGHDSIGIWTRMLRPGSFVVRYGTDPHVLDQTSEERAVDYDHDLTGSITLTGLKPDTRYYYELQNPITTGRSGRRGTFKTLPSTEAETDDDWNPRGLYNFKFEIHSCQNQNPRHGSGPYVPGIRTLVDEHTGEGADHVDFAIANGDWLYEARRNFGPRNWAAANQVPRDAFPDILRTIPQTTGVWENYKFFYDQAPPLTQWHSQVPTYFMFDDHEILNDIWGAGEAGLVDRRALFRDIGLRAWYDYVGWSNEIPFEATSHFGIGTTVAGGDTLVDTAADFTKLKLDELNNLHIHWGGDTSGINENELDTEPPVNPSAGVYDIVEVVSPTTLRISPKTPAVSSGSYSIGRRNYWKKTVANCDLFFLDTRGMRGLHDTAKPFMKGLSLLGKEQSEWLVRESKASDADFLFIVSTVPYMIPHVGGEAIRDGAIGGGKDEAWTVFLEEREMLTNTWDALDKPVCILTGDLHNSFAIQITDNVYEFACGPMGSNNHTAADEAFRPPNGTFQYGPRECDILWSTWFPPDVSRANLKHLSYATIQVNNVFDAPKTFEQNDKPDSERKIAFPRPQVIVSYYDGHTGKLRFAHSMRATPRE